MKDNTKLLPERIECPYCGEEIELEEKKVKERKYTCPKCHNNIDNLISNKSSSTISTKDSPFDFNVLVNSDEDLKNNSNIKKIFLTILGIIIIFYCYAYLYENDNGYTLFEKREMGRYNQTIKDKEFNKVQIFIYCRNMLDGSISRYESEELGINSYEIINFLNTKGFLSGEWYKKNIDELQNNIDDVKMNYVKKVQSSAIDYIIHKMASTMDVQEIFKKSPLMISIAIKRKWYHYLLF